jgi:hypothetical protein
VLHGPLTSCLVLDRGVKFTIFLPLRVHQTCRQIAHILHVSQAGGEGTSCAFASRPRTGLLRNGNRENFYKKGLFTVRFAARVD